MAKSKQYTPSKSAVPIAPTLVDAISIINDAADQVARNIDDAKDGPADLARIYIQLRLVLEEVTKAVGRLVELRDKLNTTIIPESYEAHGVTSQTVLDHRITVAVLVRASIAADQKEGAYKWLRDQGFGTLITETVNASSLAALAKTLMQDEGRELPDNLFKTYTVPSVSMTKVK
jgi:hypothetical protein